ncbi:MAG: hypothetical protein JWN86_3549 [Planctomycetota bacterium]|nr:hypothetical protein [Planctomycetota bacterium]
MPVAAITIDLNADLGEGFPWDAALISRVSSASLSCGFHAGDRATILPTLRAAIARGISLGAHPGYPDREGFGRREMAMNRDEVASLILEQCEALSQMAAEVGERIRFLKPHGALYNQAQRDPEIADGIVSGAASLGLPVLGLPGGDVQRAAGAAGVRFVAEGFADRGYREDGRLIPRDQPGAILHDPEAIAEQVLRLVRSGRVKTLCLHGDNPESVALADLVRATLDRHGITVRGFAT